MKYKNNSSYTKDRKFKKKKRVKDMEGLCVRVYNNNIEDALKRFKRKMKDSKLFLELQQKRYYTKPSDKRREVISRARIRDKIERQKV
jgi:small subunit ribosomal protein S21